MSLILSGSEGLSDVDGTAATPAIRGTDTNTGIFFPAADTIAFAEGGVEVARFDSSGNLGLGVTPSAWWSSVKALQVSGASLLSAGTEATLSANAFLDSGITWRYRVNGNATYAEQASGAFRWYTAPSGTAGNAISFTQAMTLDASGNLGIGTSSPSFRLDVRSTSGALGNFQLTSGTNAFIHLSDTSRSYGIFSNSGSWGVFDNTASVERMRITSGGDFLVGTTSADPIGARVNGMSFLPSGSQVNAMASGSRSGAFGRYTNTGDIIQLFYHNGSTLIQVGGISTNGTNASFNTSSDYRLKENIQPMTGALAKVAALKPCTYKWKTDGSDGEGFIAHELQAVVPDAVVGEKDAVDADGNPVYQGIDTSFLVATLTAAIQELKAELDAVKTELAALKGTA